MAVASRRISVVVEGNSSSAQEAMAKAMDAMTKLGDVIVKQSNLAIEYDKKVIDSNDAVMASYDRMLSTITRASEGVDAAISTQTASQKKMAESAGATSDTIVDAAGRQANAVRSAAATFDEAVDSQIAGLDRVGDVANSVSGDIVAAAERQVEAMRVQAVAFDEAADAQVAGLDRVAEAANVSADGVAKAAEKQSAAMKVSADSQVAAQKRIADTSVASATKQDAAFSMTGQGLSKLGKNTVLTAAGIGAASIYMASKFESSTTRLLTQAGATTKQVGLMRTGILNMAGEVGQSPEKLSESLYHVVSAMNAILPPATRTNEELKIQRVAAEGAAVGHTDLEETTYALSSAMNALHVNAGQAEHTMGTLNAIVGAGDMTMEDLLAAMKSGLIPTARSFGISLQSVGSALAVMGDQGMRGAMAGTRLRMSIALLAAPSAKAAEMLGAIGLSQSEITARTGAMSEALEKAGLTTTKMAEDIRQPNGLSVAFKDLDEHLKESGLSSTETAALLSRAFGGGRMGATIMLLSQSTERLDAKYKQINDTTNTFGKDWGDTQHTLTQEAKELESGLESLGVKAGDVLIPKAEELVGTLKEVFHWFEENKDAAKVLEYTVGGVLATAVGVYAVGSFLKLANSLKSATGEYSKLQNYFRSAGSSTAAGAAAGEGGITSTTKGVLGSGSAIYGSRGSMMPGSIANPIVVVIEAGQFAGLGGRAAAAEVSGATAAENDAAKSEAVSKGGVILPPGATADEEAKTASTPVEEAAGAAGGAETEAVVAGSVASTVKGFIGPLVANAMKGGLIAGIGIIGSQVAGSAIGGKTGKDVSSIGSDTAIGAAIGTVIEPGIGTAIGGGLGLIAGSLKSLLDTGTQGQHVAESAGAGMGASVQAQLAHGIDNANKIAEKALYEADHPKQPGPAYAGPGAHGQPTGKATAEELAEIEARKHAEQFGVGKTFGKSLVSQELNVTSGMSSMEQITAVITDTEKRFAKLPEAARVGALDSIVEMVKQYQDKGKLPPTSVEELVRAIDSKFPALDNAFNLAGVNSVTALNQALKGQNTLTGIEGLVNQWRNVLPELPHLVGLNMTDAEKTFAQVNSQMTVLAHSGPESERAAVSEIYKKMRDEEIHYFGEMRHGVEGEIKQLGSRMKTEAPTVVKPLETAFQRVVGVIQGEMAAGVKEAGKGTAEINKILVKELQALGIKPDNKILKQSGSFGPGPGSGANPLQPTQVGGSSGFSGLAQGGLISIGRQGEAGRDTVPLNIGGIPVIAGKGEKVAIFNRHQESKLNTKLASEGGLTGFFSSNKKANYMAGGGIVSGDFSKPQLESLWDEEGGPASKAQIMAAIALAESAGKATAESSFSDHGSHAQGLWQIEMPMNAAYVPGGNAKIPAANAKGAIAILQSQGLGAWETYTSGAYRQYLGAAGGGGAAITEALPPSIKAPHAGGSGVTAELAQAVLNKVAAAANSKLEAEGGQSSVSSTGGGSTLGGGTSGISATGAGTTVPKAPWNPDSKPIATWIVPVLDWAAQHGWHGAVTSGYRTPAEQIRAANEYAARVGQSVSSLYAGGNPLNSNHLKTTYPGGAVDVAGDTDAQLISMLQGYPGPQKLKGGNLGPGDPYHFSESGFAGGGIVEQLYASSGITSPSFKITTKTVKQQAKQKLTKSASKKANTKAPAKTDIAKKLGNLKYMLGLEDIPGMVAPFEKDLSALGNLAGLVKTMEGNKAGPVILQSDMQYLAGLAGAGLHPGMTTEAAYRIYEQALVEHGQTPDLELEGQIIKWAEGQADHRLLTDAQAGILTPAGAAVGWVPKAGKPLMAIQEDIAYLELNQLGGEEHRMGGIVGHLGSVIEERKEREHRLEKLKTIEKRRSNHLKGDLERLQKSSLKGKLAAAMDAAYQSERVQDAEEHKDAIEEARAPIEALPTKDRSKEDERSLTVWATDEAKLKTYLTGIKNPVKSKKASVQRAELALLKNKLTDELKPITESLSEIDGSKAQVSVNGLLSEIKTITGDKETSEGELSAISTAKIPSAQENLESIQQAMVESEIPKVVPPTAEESNTALAQAREAELTVLATAYAVSQSQYAVLKNFETNLPHFESGGPVLQDGPIYAHRGEHVVPEGGTLVAHGGGDVNLHHTTVVAHDDNALIKVIDSRITHPDNVRLVSRIQNARVQGFPGYRGSRRG